MPVMNVKVGDVLGRLTVVRRWRDRIPDIDGSNIKVLTTLVRLKCECGAEWELEESEITPKLVECASCQQAKKAEGGVGDGS